MIAVENYGRVGKIPPVAPIPTASLCLKGSGNSGLDPVFGGRGSKLWATDPIPYFLNALTGSSPSYVYNSGIDGSRMDFRLQNANDARDNPSGSNLLLICDKSDSASYSNVNYLKGILYQWCQIYWAVGADVIVYIAQPLRNPEGNGQTQGNWAWRTMEFTERAIQYCNARLPEGRNPVRIIPFNLVMERIRMDTAKGLTPTSTTGATTGADYFNSLYLDPLMTTPDYFHMGADTPAAGWLIPATVACAISGASPAGLPSATPAGIEIDAAEVLYLKRVIHDVLSGYWAAGLDTSGWVRP